MMSTQIHPTALKPLISASTMDRSRGRALARRKTRSSRSSRSTTTGNASKTKARGDISTNPTMTTKKSRQFQLPFSESCGVEDHEEALKKQLRSMVCCDIMGGHQHVMIRGGMCKPGVIE